MLPARMALSPGSLWCGPPEELPELAFIERPIRRSLKTAEEIDQLTVDEDLNDIERAVYLLSVGQEVQRLSVLGNLPGLVRQNPAETFRRVVPKVREVLNGGGAEVQLTAAASFSTVLQDDIILIHTHTYSILKIVLLQLHHHRDTVVYNAWLETLLLAINALPKETIKQEVLSTLLHHSQMSHSLQSRLASCRILGKVTLKFDSHMLKKDLLPLARSLCRDVKFEVRASMCHQLECMVRVSGVEDTRVELLQELLQLGRDQETSVRVSAFDSMVDLVELMDGDDRLHVLVPPLMSMCDSSAPLDDAFAPSLSLRFGKLCSGLAGSLSEEQRCGLLQRFQGLCAAGLLPEGNQTDDDDESTLIRCNCCYNLPAMVVFTDPSCFQSELHASFSRLCRDPEASVRRSAAATFHQVVQLLGPDVHLVHKDLLVLLQDDALEVLDALINHLDETLEAVLTREEKPTRDKQVPELLAALLWAEQKVGGSLRWRLHEKLLQRCSCLARLLPGDLLHQNFSPRIFVILTTNKVLPVQREAARTLCTFLRYNRRQEQRQETTERLIHVLAQGRSYWNRLRFLDVCETATEIFSRKYFKKHFLIPALELVHDPVANVRYKLSRMLPRLRSSLRLPADKQLLQKIDFCVQKLLCREKDKDVLDTIHKTMLDLEKLDLSEPKRPDRDLLDQKKEAEESVLLEMEHLERQQSNGKLICDKHPDRKRKEIRKAKLCRSRSLSSQPSSSRPVAWDRPLTVKDLGGSGTSSKDDSSRTTHFPGQPSSAMPVLIRSNTTSLLDRASTLDHKICSMDLRNNAMDPRTGTNDKKDSRTSTMDQRTSTLDHRTGTLNHRTGTLDHRSGSLDHRTSTLDRVTEHRKLSINRKSNSLNIQSGRD